MARGSAGSGEVTGYIDCPLCGSACEQHHIAITDAMVELACNALWTKWDTIDTGVINLDGWRKLMRERMRAALEAAMREEKL